MNKQGVHGCQMMWGHRKSQSYRMLVLGMMVVSLSACNLVKKKQDVERVDQQRGTHRFLPGDGLPPDGNIDFTTVADAMPRAEVLSDTGNQPYVVYGQSYQPLSSVGGFVQTGEASWYGTKFHGRKTSSGEIYDMYKMTAAHRTLPLPSYVRVTNEDNGQSVVVKVNDRGPFVDPETRVIDLSYVAAGKLGLLDAGTARVRLEGVPTETYSAVPKSMSEDAAIRVEPVSDNVPSDTSPVDRTVEEMQWFFVQVGAYSSADNAARKQQALSEQGVASMVVPGRLHKVRIGPFESRSQAAGRAAALRQMGLEVQVVMDSAPSQNVNNQE